MNKIVVAAVVGLLVLGVLACVGTSGVTLLNRRAIGNFIAGSGSGDSTPTAVATDESCSGPIVLYENDGEKRDLGWKLEVKETNEYLDPPYFGNASEVHVPEGCKVVLWDVAPIQYGAENPKKGEAGAHHLELGPGDYNLQAIDREGPAGSYETGHGTCEGDLKFCWSDHVVAVQIPGTEVHYTTVIDSTEAPEATSTKVPSTGGECEVTTYQNDSHTLYDGWTHEFSGTVSTLPAPYFGSISYIVVPNGCQVVLYDVAPIGSGGHTITLFAGDHNLQLIDRGGPAGPWETNPDACENGLQYCWNDRTVALVVSARP